MRTIEEIRAELPRVAFAADRYVATRKSEQQYEIELRAAITTNIPIDRLEAICAAEKDGRLVVLPDCSKCAYQQNGKISLACGNCIGGQGLDNDLFTPRAEAEAALGKEQR